VTPQRAILGADGWAAAGDSSSLVFCDAFGQHRKRPPIIAEWSEPGRRARRFGGARGRSGLHRAA